MSDLKYTCQDYRLEMMLVGLRKQLADSTLSSEERVRIETTIRELEEQIGLA
jgi:glucose-6-phosphate-specific signal transduction histidine kinase